MEYEPDYSKSQIDKREKSSCLRIAFLRYRATFRGQRGTEGSGPSGELLVNDLFLDRDFFYV
jgi:hypothetical protein